MTKELSDALADGIIDEEEAKYLDDVRKKLGLTEEKFSELKDSLLEHRMGPPENTDSDKSPCPHCGK